MTVADLINRGVSLSFPFPSLSFSISLSISSLTHKHTTLSFMSKIPLWVTWRRSLERSSAKKTANKTGHFHLWARFSLVKSRRGMEITQPVPPFSTWSKIYFLARQQRQTCRGRVFHYEGACKIFDFRWRELGVHEGGIRRRRRFGARRFWPFGNRAAINRVARGKAGVRRVRKTEREKKKRMRMSERKVFNKRGGEKSEL